MSKKKRLRKDIEKLFRAGRYWDFLRSLERESLVSENTREHQESWKALIKKALRQEQGFREFCGEVGTFKYIPKNDPDFRLLMGIRGYIEGCDLAPEVLELKGLSPDAQGLRSKLSSFDPSAVPLNKLRTLFSKFLREPDKITGRYFQQVADLLPNFAGASAERMGDLIAAARRFNGKTAVSRGWAGVDFRTLEKLDSRLERLSRHLPPALRDIFLYPFVVNIALLFQRLAPEAGNSRAARLVRAVPFLLPILAGEDVEVIRAKLLPGNGEWRSDFHALHSKVEGLSIEEKVSLLGDLRLKIGDRDRRPQEPEFGFSRFLDDEDDDDEPPPFPRERKARAEDFARSLLLLHRSIFEDISARQAEMPLRDKKELVRIMEPVLLEDIDTILDATEGPDEFLSLLGDAMDAGCAGTRLGLLAFLAASRFRFADLRKRSEKFLDQTPAPNLQDMEWLAKEWDELYYPQARSLRPLLLRYKNETDLLGVFSTQLCKLMEVDLYESSLRSRFSVFSSLLADMGGFSTRFSDFRILRSELDELSEHRELDPPRHFLRCFPGGRLSVEAHLCWLEAQRSLGGEAAVWEHTLAELKRTRSRYEEDPMEFLPIETPLQKLLKEKDEALQFFMEEHLDELASLPTVTLEPLLDELLERLKTRPEKSALLIRLEKLVAARLEGGEESVRPLMGRIRQTLQHLAGLEKKKTPKTRRSKK